MFCKNIWLSKWTYGAKIIKLPIENWKYVNEKWKVYLSNLRDLHLKMNFLFLEYFLFSMNNLMIYFAPSVFLMRAECFDKTNKNFTSRYSRHTSQWLYAHTFNWNASNTFEWKQTQIRRSWCSVNHTRIGLVLGKLRFVAASLFLIPNKYILVGIFVGARTAHHGSHMVQAFGRNLQ